MGWGEGIGEIALWRRGVAVEKAITGWWSEGLGRRGEQGGRNGRRKGRKWGCRVWEKGRAEKRSHTLYLLTQHSVNLRVLAEEG